MPYAALPPVTRATRLDLADARWGAMLAARPDLAPAVALQRTLSGRVIEVNEMLLDEPDKLNEAALDEGWLFKVEPSDEAEYEDLMDADDYEDFIDTLS